MQLWYNLTVLRQGAFTGCARCELVCPVGEDYPVIERSPVRQRDLPDEPLTQIVDGTVRLRRSTQPESE